ASCRATARRPGPACAARPSTTAEPGPPGRAGGSLLRPAGRSVLALERRHVLRRPGPEVALRAVRDLVDQEGPVLGQIAARSPVRARPHSRRQVALSLVPCV